MQLSVADAKDVPRWASPAALLVAVNLIPLLGAMFWGWSLFEIVLLYWFENVVIGGVNIVKIITCVPGSPEMQLQKLFLVPFFCVHYGLFCFVHGVFVFALLNGQGAMAQNGFPHLTEMLGEVLAGGTLVAAVALIASHLYSFAFHYLYGGEYRRTNVAKLFIAPYGRIVLLHLSLLFGAFAIVALGQPLLLVLLLIGGKTLLDLQLHVRSHRRSSAPT